LNQLPNDGVFNLKPFRSGRKPRITSAASFHGTASVFGKITLIGKRSFSQALPRSLEKNDRPSRAAASNGGAYTKVSWLKGNFSAGLPIQLGAEQWPSLAESSAITVTG
jgi:hypothetical protein